jgi:hypothetical protein
MIKQVYGPALEKYVGAWEKKRILNEVIDQHIEPRKGEYKGTNLD